LDHVCWTTGGEVRRVGLRAGRFVEARLLMGSFVEACISWVHGQVIAWVTWMCVVYEALGKTLRMNFVVAFLELWLGMVSLELWLGILGKHVAFLELWLEMASLELWLGIADGHECNIPKEYY